MRVFAPCILLPATLLLLFLAVRGQSETRFIIVQGALAGLVAAVTYDLFRLPFVLAGKPLFDVFPQFGQLLLYGHLVAGDKSLPVQLVGWAYHFQNGMALGIMGAAMIPLRLNPPPDFGVAWRGRRASRYFYCCRPIMFIWACICRCDCLCRLLWQRIWYLARFWDCISRAAGLRVRSGERPGVRSRSRLTLLHGASEPNPSRQNPTPRPLCENAAFGFTALI